MISKRNLGKVAIAALTAAALAGGTLTLVHAEQPAKSRYFSFAGKVPTIHENNIRDIQVLVTGDQSAGRQSVLESYWGPGFSVPPHFHKKHAETFLILSGQVEWTIGGETHVAGPGDAVHIPPNTVHSVKVIGGKEMHSIMISEPGGYEEISAYEASFTPEQRKDPALAKQLNALADFNRAD
jgi:quercetin dioxygenase-like cupin family protein